MRQEWVGRDRHNHHHNQSLWLRLRNSGKQQRGGVLHQSGIHKGSDVGSWAQIQGVEKAKGQKGRGKLQLYEISFSSPS